LWKIVLENPSKICDFKLVNPTALSSLNISDWINCLLSFSTATESGIDTSLSSIRCRWLIPGEDMLNSSKAKFFNFELNGVRTSDKFSS